MLFKKKDKQEETVQTETAQNQAQVSNERSQATQVAQAQASQAQTPANQQPVPAQPQPKAEELEVGIKAETAFEENLGDTLATKKISKRVYTEDEEAGEEDIEEEKSTITSVFKKVGTVIGVIIGTLFILGFVLFALFQTYKVDGTSMYPTLDDGDRLIVSKLGRTWASVTRKDYIPSRGQIIILKNPVIPSIQLVKRVIGLPGDRVVLKDEVITIYNNDNPDGFAVDESLGLELEPTWGEVDLVVPEGNIFVCGDNRIPGGSLDSRNEIGPVPAEYIVGKVSLRFLPVSQINGF